MKNQRLVEALKVFEIKEVLEDKRDNKHLWSPYWLAYRSVHRSASWSATHSAYWSSRSAYWSAYCSASGSARSAYYSAQLDKPKVLEIIKGKLK